MRTSVFTKKVAPLFACSLVLLLGSCRDSGVSVDDGPDDPVPVSTVEVEPASGAVTVGGYLPMTARPKDQYGNELTGRVVTWASSNDTVATVNDGGLVRGRRVGAVRISASCEGQSGGADLTVFVNLSLVSPGGNHTCAMSNSAAAFCWGEGGFGQLGDGTSSDRLVPEAVEGDLVFFTLSSGHYHACGIVGGGTAYCWGQGGGGQLGRGSTTNASVPARVVGGGLSFTQIQAGGSHTCGIATGGRAYCWGEGGSGQLGTGSISDQLTPALVAGGLTFTSITTGADHTCAVATDGGAYCWGQGEDGELGDGSTSSSLLPVPVAGELEWTRLSAGDRHTCGVATGGVAYCWGYGAYGRLGNGTDTISPTPTPVSGELDFSTVHAGESHTCGLTSAAAAYCWGSGADGVLGDGDESSHVHLEPTLVQGGLEFTSLSVGVRHSCGVTSSDGAYCWGSGTMGQLGQGEALSASVPTLVFGTRVPQ